MFNRSILLTALITCLVLLSLYLYIQKKNPFINCPLPKIADNKEFNSQYLEDYILSIIFKDIKNGYYIDVGANNPNKDSVTKYFYEKGWRGINIEPIEEHYKAFLKYRPEDINLNIGISNKDGSLKFSHIHHKDPKEGDGLSTFDQEVYDKALKDGYFAKSFSVPVKPLNDVLKEHSINNIHFINIDVEGMEKEVISSIDLKKYRPWLFIIEATEPRTFIRSDHRWKDLLESNDYIWIMFDGINSYFIAREHYQQLYKEAYQAYKCALNANKKFKIINNELQFINK